MNPVRSIAAQARTIHARARPDTGMSTAEYAVGTVAACGFAALLFKILTSPQVHHLVVALVTHALHLAG